MKQTSAKQPRSAERGGISQVADKLPLAAAPLFACMAVSTWRYEDAHDVICGAASGISWNSMVVMYLLMCLVHLLPWIKLLTTGHVAPLAPSRPSIPLHKKAGR